MLSIFHPKNDPTIMQIRHDDASYNAGFLFIRAVSTGRQFAPMSAASLRKPL
jgi:hypothetical protein